MVSGSIETIGACSPVSAPFLFEIFTKGVRRLYSREIRQGPARVVSNFVPLLLPSLPFPFCLSIGLFTLLCGQKRR